MQGFSLRNGLRLEREEENHSDSLVSLVRQARESNVQSKGSSENPACVRK